MHATSAPPHTHLNAVREQIKDKVFTFGCLRTGHVHYINFTKEVSVGRQNQGLWTVVGRRR